LFAIVLSRKACRLFQVFALGGSIAILSACGSADDTDASATVASRQQSPPHSIQGCLARHGAVRARTVKDLSVLAKAEEENDVSKPGFAYDKAASIIVDVWTGSSVENRPAPWMLWIGHPFGKKLTPEEIVVNRPPKSYVMYVTSATKRRRAESCISFSSKGKGRPTEVDLTGQ